MVYGSLEETCRSLRRRLKLVEVGRGFGVFGRGEVGGAGLGAIKKEAVGGAGRCRRMVGSEA